MELAMALAGEDDVDQVLPVARRSWCKPRVMCTAESDVTVQSFKQEADVNTIVRRFGVTLELNVGAAGPGEFGDFTGAGDFHEAMNRVNDALTKFAALPAAMRTRFGNDPGKFFDYIHSSDNLEEAVHLGILDRSALPAVPVAPANTPVVTQPTTAEVTRAAGA